MKKVITLAFLFLFLITNSGFSITRHYCGGKLASINLFSTDAHPCPCGKKAMKKGCCKNETTTIKAKTDLNKVSQVVVKTPIQPLILVTQIVVKFSLSKPSVLVFNHLPSYKAKIPIYLLDRVFRI